ncbi:hypothetical protein BDF19DRAFT_453999 [Syncephalis fuscata]|nr:hypothetical protein BDF19DRAFT_453982 [Syncephalis fuscata]KAI9591719.1 hypothetical protein BDF19DRAFT_453999 [Syncephalis fuscata]
MQFSLSLAAVLLASAASLIQAAPNVAQSKNIRIWWLYTENTCLHVVEHDPTVAFSLSVVCHNSHWIQTPIPAETPAASGNYFTLKSTFNNKCLTYNPNKNPNGHGSIITMDCKPNSKDQHWEMLDIEHEGKVEQKLSPRTPRYGNTNACVRPIRLNMDGKAEYEECNHRDPQQYCRIEKV